MDSQQPITSIRELNRPHAEAAEEALRQSRIHQQRVREHLERWRRAAEERERLQRLRGVPLFWRY